LCVSILQDLEQVKMQRKNVNNSFPLGVKIEQRQRKKISWLICFFFFIPNCSVYPGVGYETTNLSLNL
jgi:hypothetical protein